MAGRRSDNPRYEYLSKVIDSEVETISVLLCTYYTTIGWYVLQLHCHLLCLPDSPFIRSRFLIRPNRATLTLCRHKRVAISELLYSPARDQARGRAGGLGRQCVSSWTISGKLLDDGLL